MMDMKQNYVPPPPHTEFSGSTPVVGFYFAFNAHTKTLESLANLVWSGLDHYTRCTEMKVISEN